MEQSLKQSSSSIFSSPDQRDSKRHPRMTPWFAMAAAALLASTLWGCATTEMRRESSHSEHATGNFVQDKTAKSRPESETEQIRPSEDQLSPAEPEQFMDEEIARFEALGESGPIRKPDRESVDYDFPVVINKHVQFYLDYFQHDIRSTFSRWLARSGRYVPMIRKELKSAGLPQDLAWLPMIESGFSLTAYSRARAVGPWQFMAPTARQYGLTINDYLDERRDPIKSTHAAIAFLSDLYAEFGCWELAVAAYNAGGGRIRNAMRRYDSTDFWEISSKNHLSRETRHYVPKLIAAIIIAKNPEKYGFANIAYDAPLRYETIEVPRWTSLEAVALAGELDFDQLRELNRQLRRTLTPPEDPSYTLRLPPGKTALVAENLPRVHRVAKIEYRTHKVKRGDTLTKVCKIYNINKTTLLKANSLNSEQLIIGQRLRIPVQHTAYKLLPKGADPDKVAGVVANDDNGLLLHTIRRGESLWTISKRYGVGVDTIASWNDIHDPKRIKAGRQLALYLAPSPSQSIAPAQKETRTAAAGKGRPNLIAGPAKRAPQTSNSKPKVTYYQVRGGDTLWSIARKFRVTTSMLREWNQLSNDLIHPGKELIIRLAQAVL